MHHKILTILLFFLLIPVFSYPAPNTQYNADRNIPFGDMAEDVNPQTGALSISVTDLTLPGRGGLDLVISRTYCSTLANLYNMGLDKISATTYATTRTRNTHLDKKYGLGSGWKFNFPSMEINHDLYDIEHDSPGTQVNLYMGGGSVFSVTITGSAEDNNLDHYEILDMVIEEDKTYTDYSVTPPITSWYCLTLKSMKKYYFDSRGNLLLIRDPSGRNKIHFHYLGEIDSEYGYPKSAKINRIIDSVGRSIEFYYNQANEPYFGIPAQCILKEITWEDPEGETSKRIQYLHKFLTPSDNEYIGASDTLFILQAVIDNLGRKTHYTYSIDPAFYSFGYIAGNPTGDQTNIFANLIKIERNYQDNTLSSSSTEYLYGYTDQSGTRRTPYRKHYFEYGGYMEYYKVVNRWDSSKDEKIYHQTSYSYVGEPYDEPLEYSCTVQYANGTTEKFVYSNDENQSTYNSQHVCVRKEKVWGVHLGKKTYYRYNYYSCPKSKEIHWARKENPLQPITPEDYIQVSIHGYTYDQYKDLIEDINELGVKTTYAYHPIYHKPVKSEAENIDALGRSFPMIAEWVIDLNTGDILEKRVKHNDRKIRVELNEYDQYGNLIIQTDAHNNQTTFEYDPNYNAYLIKATRRATDNDGTRQNIIEEYGYYNNGLKRWEKDANGHRTSYTYDAVDRPLIILNEEDSTFREYQYMDLECITTSWDEKRHQTDKHSDGLDHLLRIEEYEDASSYAITHFAYDNVGNQIQKKDPEGHTTDFKYDGFNRLIETLYADNTKSYTLYRDADKRKDIIDTNGHRTQYQYDELGQLKAVREYLGEYDESGNLKAQGNPAYETTQYHYDNIGNIIETIDARNHSTLYLYDDLSRLINVLYPDDTFSDMEYDDLGNLKLRTDRNGNSTNYNYDEVNRLTETIYPDQSKILYWYMPAGQRSKVQDSNSLTIYQYNERDRLIKVIQTIQTKEYVTEYDYDEVGNCTGIKGPLSDTWLIRTYDDLHRLEEISGYAQFIYYKTGHLHKTFYASGLITEILRDSRNRPKRIYTSNEILDLNYIYDGESNVRGINQDTFTYDALDRLKSASLVDKTLISNEEQREWIIQSFGSYKGEPRYQERADINKNGIVDGKDLLLIAYGYRPPEITITYEYDALGNRTKRTGETTGTYSYDICNRLTSEIRNGEETLYDYDKNGNLKTKISPTETFSYIYDYENRLVEVIRGETEKIAEYLYDADGKRIKKIVHTENIPQTTLYHYDQWGQVICESDGTGSVISRYIIAHGKQLAKVEPQGTSYYHQDHLGSARVMTDENGVEVWWEDYYPFGEKFNGESLGDTTPYRFTGKEKDEETGLYYYGARFYDPLIGRFISEDPVVGDWEDPQSLNRYVYCRNNPLKYLDPKGESFFAFVAAVVVITGIYKTAKWFMEDINPQIGVGKRSNYSIAMDKVADFADTDRMPMDKTPDEVNFEAKMIFVKDAAKTLEHLVPYGVSMSPIPINKPGLYGKAASNILNWTIKETGELSQENENIQLDTSTTDKLGSYGEEASNILEGTIEGSSEFNPTNENLQLNSSDREDY